MQLLSFPFAGGNAFSYRDLAAQLRPAIALVTAELPGRGARADEPLVSRMAPLVDILFAEWRPQLIVPYALYGHSMGALVAFEFAHRAVIAGFPPAMLIVSGRAAPSVPERRQRYCLPSPQFRTMLRDLGGFPPGVLESEDLMDFFEPILRADFEVIETHACISRPKLDVPITVAIGDHDDATVETARLWELETTRGTQLTVFRGDHFFIQQHSGAMAQLIAGALTGIVRATG